MDKTASIKHAWGKRIKEKKFHIIFVVTIILFTKKMLGLILVHIPCEMKSPQVFMLTRIISSKGDVLKS